MRNRGKQRKVEIVVPVLPKVTVVDFPGLEESIPRARKAVRERLGEDHPAFETTALLVSELATNAIVHTRSRNGKFSLAITEQPGLIHVDVIDAGSDKKPTLVLTELAENGRGLFLVHAIADAWGVHDDEAGRAIWFEVAF